MDKTQFNWISTWVYEILNADHVKPYSVELLTQLPGLVWALGFGERPVRKFPSSPILDLSLPVRAFPGPGAALWRVPTAGCKI